MRFGKIENLTPCGQYFIVQIRDGGIVCDGTSYKLIGGCPSSTPDWIAVCQKITSHLVDEKKELLASRFSKAAAQQFNDDFAACTIDTGDDQKKAGGLVKLGREMYGQDLKGSAPCAPDITRSAPIFATALTIKNKKVMDKVLSALKSETSNLAMLAGFDLLPEPGPEADPEADKSHALKMAGPQLFAAALAIDGLEA
ncbi:hypothetical protein, partial [Paraburkholderia sediminicola]|uniref:hypothetical protein n=1 Tax=Paraburkholderia sediminicola TaxID=458836 RepID=UPI0038B76D65